MPTLICCFGVEEFEKKTCFEQVSVISFTSLEKKNLVCRLQVNLIGTYWCKFRFSGNCWLLDI